jgi:D-galactarolactone cycloisomerase
VRAVREAIGSDIRLMVDANHSLTVPTAIRMGRQLEVLDIAWFKEPISPEDTDGYVEVTRALDIAIAAGESEFTRWGFREAITHKAMDIVQPDVCAVGGITECKKIVAMATAHGVECVPHAWGSAVGLAATIHFLASIPDHPPCLSRRPDAGVRAGGESVPRSLGKEPIRQSGGKVTVPTAPGLGIEVDRAVIDRYRTG